MINHMRLLFCIFSVLSLAINQGFVSASSLPAGRNSADIKGRFHNIEGENAYFIYSNIEMEVINENSNCKPEEFKPFAVSRKVAVRYNSRMKLNTKSAIQDYAYISLNKESRTIIKSFEITTYKPDGTTIKFDSSQIFHSMLPDMTDTSNKLDLMKYVIPGIEPGDEIKVNYSFEYEGDITSKLYGNIFFTQDLPALRYSFKILLPYPYNVFYKCYNGFKEPVVENTETKAICTFSQDSCFAVKDASQASLFNEVPYFYFSLEFDKKLEEYTRWKDLYNQFEVIAKAPIYIWDPYDREYNRWVKQNLKDLKEKDNFQKFEILYNRIRENLENDSKKEENNMLGLYQHSSDNEFYVYKACKPYAKLLKHLGIDYYVCFARNKYNGIIDENFIRKDEITDILLMYYDNDSNMIMIYPNDYIHNYYLNELPGYLSGTDAMMIKMPVIESKKGKKNDNWAMNDANLSIRKISIQKGNERVNYFYRLRNVGISTKNEVSSYYSKINLSGYTSTDNRPIYKVLFMGKDSYNDYLTVMENDTNIFRVDSIYKKTESCNYPFKFTVSLSGKLGKFYNYVNDSTIIISIDDILNNNIVNYDRESRNLDLLLPFAYSDIQDLIIDFDRPVNIINLEALHKELSNGAGSYKFEVIRIGDNKLKLTSTYVIKKDIIELESLNQLNDLNDAASEMANSRVIVNIKSSDLQAPPLSVVPKPE